MKTKKKKIFLLFSVGVLLFSLVQSVLADTYTRYPPYGLGFSGGNSSGVGFQDYRHNIFLSNGTARLYSSVWSVVVGGALAEAWGFMGIEWTAPSRGGGGGGGGDKLLLSNARIVTVTSKITLKGYAYVFAWSYTPAIGARCLYLFQVWLWVYDVTGGSYVTQTLLDEKSEEAVSGAYIPDWKSYEWNFDKDYSATFNAVEGHKYQIQFGVYVGVKGATIAGSFNGYVDFVSSNRYIVIQYIYLSW